MTESQFQEWLNELAEIWETRDPERAANFFSDVKNYYETPFSQPVNSKQDILEIWKEVPVAHDKVDVETKIISIENNLGIAHWNAKFTRIPSNQPAELDGIYQVKFNDKNEFIEFRQWYNSKY